MTGQRERNKAETRAALISAVAELTIAGREVTARTIAAKAGLSTGALFGHWDRIWELQVEAAQLNPAMRDVLVAAREAEIRQLRGEP